MKRALVIRVINGAEQADWTGCITVQHSQMLGQVLRLFEIKASGALVDSPQDELRFIDHVEIVTLMRCTWILGLVIRLGTIRISNCIHVPLWNSRLSLPSSFESPISIHNG